jgi:hypothetical protein
MTKEDIKFAKLVLSCLLDLTGDDNWQHAKPEALVGWGAWEGAGSAYDVANEILNQGVEPCHCGYEES